MELNQEFQKQQLRILEVQSALFSASTAVCVPRGRNLRKCLERKHCGRNIIKLTSVEVFDDKTKVIGTIRY
jgi:hypothetical protein